MEQTSQTKARRTRFERLTAELSSLGGAFGDLKKGVAAAAKNAAKRRDDLLLEHTRKEHLS